MKDGEPCTSRGVSTVLEGVTPRPLTKGSMAWRFLPYEGIAHGLEKVENIVVISTHTGQVVERAHTSVCPKMVGNLPPLVPVLNVPLQPVDPVLELWMVCQKDGAQTGQSLGINICLFHQIPPNYFPKCSRYNSRTE